jgi:hypothetical protein
MYEVIKNLLIFACGDILKSLEAASRNGSRYEAEPGTSTYCREARDDNPLLPQTDSSFLD